MRSLTMKLSNKIISITVVSIIVILLLLIANTVHSFDSQNKSMISANVIKAMLANKTKFKNTIDQLAFEGAYKININKGDSFSLVISGDKKILDKISVSHGRNSLTISKNKNFRLRRSGVATVNITLPNVNNIALYGKNNANIRGDFNEMKLNASGDTKLYFNITNARDFVLNSRGNSDIQLEGITEKLTINAAGKLNLDASQLLASNVNVRGSGENKITVNVNRLLSVALYGNAEINYLNEPDYINNHSFGNVRLRKV